MYEIELSILFCIVLINEVTLLSISSDEVNECASTPCINGICVDGENFYICICDQGFTGVNCEGIFDCFFLE